MRLAGSTVVVTGGASGLGLATAELLCAGGARVLLIDRDADAGSAAAHLLGAAATFAAADVASDADVRAALESVAGQEIRGLVHCAGRGGDRLRILDRDGTAAPLDSFNAVVETNLVGTYNVLRLVAERIARSTPVDGERGSVVLTASVAAFDGQIGQTSYAAAKAGVHGMTLVAARDLASRLIRVNTIAPGLFDTPMLARLRPDVREALAASVPHPKRLGSPADYAELAVQLLSNGYVNGETVRLDGGIRMAAR